MPRFPAQDDSGVRWSVPFAPDDPAEASGEYSVGQLVAQPPAADFDERFGPDVPGGPGDLGEADDTPPAGLVSDFPEPPGFPFEEEPAAPPEPAEALDGESDEGFDDEPRRPVTRSTTTPAPPTR